MADNFSSPFVGLLEGVSASISSLRTAAVAPATARLTFDDVGPGATAVAIHGEESIQGTGGGC